MQKNLLSLFFVANCGFMYAAETTKNVPTITPEQHEKNKELCTASKVKIVALGDQLLKEKENKYTLELELHSYDQRKIFTEKLIEELSYGGDRVSRHKESSNQEVEEQGKDKKKNAGGVNGVLWGWVTPEEESICAKEMKLVDKLTAGKKDINEKLYKETKGYQQIVEDTIFPDLKKNLAALYVGMNTMHLEPYRACRDFQGDEYCACLGEAAISEARVDQLLKNKYQNAYVRAMQKGVPATYENIHENAHHNKITTKEANDLDALVQELKREIRRGTTVPKAEGPELTPDVPKN